MKFQRDFIDKIKESTNLVELVSEYTELKQEGRYIWRGKCPHPDHDDSTASFTINTRTNSWCCYGCHSDKKGINNNYGSDCIAFIQWINQGKMNWVQSVEYLAKRTPGFSGADLENLLNEAAIIATRNKHKKISNADIENAVKKITVGLEKTNRVVSDKDKKLTAYHEAGHAVVSKFLPTQTDVKEVSIIPRGLAGGYTMYKTNEDKYYVSKTELLEKMVALMGGRAAEKIALNEISTGASNDIEVATGIAKDMLTVYGMDDKLGPISLKVDDPYEIQIFGEKVIDEVGNQIQILIDNAYKTAQEILRENMDILDRVAQALLEKEKITSEEFEEFFK